MADFFNELGATISHFFATAGLKILEVIAVVVFGIAVVKIVKRALKKLLVRSPLDSSLVSFSLSIVNFLLYLALLMIVCRILSIPTTSFIAVISAIGLALSLALQGSLSNLANGVVIISTKPFSVGDYVEIDSISGTVKSIKMLHTKLETPDNKLISVPNSKVISATVTNYNANALRRVDLDISVAYGTDTDDVKRVLLDCVKSTDNILDTPEPLVRMKSQSQSALVYTLRAWCAKEDYWTVYFDLTEKTYKALSDNGISIPFNQLDVHLVDGKGKAE